MVRSAALAPAGRFAENIAHFVHALRKAGVKVGTAQLEDAIRAVGAISFTRREDFYFTLRATLITRADDLEVFHRVFTIFWRDPAFLDQLLAMMSPTVRRPDEPQPKPAAGDRRAAEALAGPKPPAPAQEERLDLEMSLDWSGAERLRSMDFEQMSAAEATEAARLLSGLRLPVPPIPTRRLRPATRGSRVDLRATLRRSLRRGGELDALAFGAPRERPPDLVALCDISGSMSAYSRMLMIFLHALAHAPQGNWGRVSAFTFGTRLTNVSRALARRDPDLALARIAEEAQDWKGGTRIGEALERFNKDWSRRVLGQGAVVLLITDGLERGDPLLLSLQAERLARSCRRLIWLNPLLRWQGFTPEAAGIRALWPHVSELRACHNLDSLSALADALAGGDPRRAAGGRA